jgi:HEAT repeat protein
MRRVARRGPMRRALSSFLSRLLRLTPCTAVPAPEDAAPLVGWDASWPDTNALLNGPLRTARGAEDIRYLAPLLCSGEESVWRPAAARAASWLAAIRPADLPRVDGAFRGWMFVYHARARPWTDLTADTLLERGRDPDRAGPLFMLASFHSRGFIRQEAVAALARRRDGAELPFLMLRLNDWVGPVRAGAEVALAERLGAGDAAPLARALPLVLRLESATRNDVTGVARRVLDVLGAADGGRLLLEGLRDEDPLARRTCLRAALRSEALRWPALRAASASSDPMLRLAAVRGAANAAPGSELWELASTCVRDPLAAVRREALQALDAAFPDRALPVLEGALLDGSAPVRKAARSLLRSRGRGDFAGRYREALSSGQRLAAALYGLGETGERADVEHVLVHLGHPSPSVRRAAVEALGALDGDRQVGRLLEALESATPGVSRAGRTALSGRAHAAGGPRLWAILASSPHPHVRLNALAVMAALDRWDSLPLLVRAAAGTTPLIAMRARNGIDALLAGYNRRFFTQPGPAQRASLEEALRTAAPHLSAAVVEAIARIVHPKPF